MTSSLSDRKIGRHAELTLFTLGFDAAPGVTILTTLGQHRMRSDGSQKALF